MNKHASDPLRDVDALVQAYLAKQSEGVDGAVGLARVQASLKPTPHVVRRGRGRRLAFAAGIAAALALAFFSGWHLGPAQAGARDLVEEVKRVHNLPLARCYLVEVQRIVDADEDGPAGKPAREVQVWTRGDRFWVEMRHDEPGPPFTWGRGANGSLWAVLDAQRGVRVPLEQTPRPLQRVADLYTLNVDTLLADVLQDCTLTEESSQPSKLTRVVVAEPRSERTRRWLGKATLDIDGEAKVLRRLVLVRNVLGKAQARVTFTLLNTRADDDAEYQLEGHLTAPFRIFEGNLEPRMKLELLGRWFGVRKEARDKHPVQPAELQFKDLDGHAQTPLGQTDKKATVLFFLLPDCPISNSYAPEIKRICAAYGPKKVALFVVHADPDVTVEQAKKHAKDYGFSCPVLLDPAHVLVKKSGATKAPEVAVLAPDGKVLYRGRIDDWYADYGSRRAQPTQRDLRDALDTVVEGKAVRTATTQVIGCFLPDPKK